MPAKGEYVVPKRIRVGLMGNFSGLTSVNELPVKNKNLKLGILEEDFRPYDTLSSSTGFILGKQDGSLIRLRKKYDTKAAAEEIQKRLVDRNKLAVVGIDPTIGWYVYLMGIQSEGEGQKLLAEIGLEEEVETDQLKGRGLRILDGTNKILSIYSSSRAIPLQFQSGDAESIPLVKLNGSYRGTLEIRRFSNSDLTVINELTIEEYLYGVIPNESPASWNIEALKAQTLAARSYAVFQIRERRFKQFDFDVCRTITSQVYYGYGYEQPSTNRAVDETKGQVVLYNGNIANTMFFSSSGGHTQDSKYLYNDLPYLKGVPEIASYEEKNLWQVTKTPGEIKQALGQRGVNIGEIIDINIVEVNPSGRMQKIFIEGTNGRYELSGKAEQGKPTIRSFFGLKDTMVTLKKNGQQSSIKFVDKDGNVKDGSMEKMTVQGTNGRVSLSAALQIITSKGREMLSNSSSNSRTTLYTFEGKGNGHGIGMSQWGAQYMALAGYNYRDIITHYYTGVTIQE